VAALVFFVVLVAASRMAFDLIPPGGRQRET
jgi:hypothetical protein